MKLSISILRLSQCYLRIYYLFVTTNAHKYMVYIYINYTTNAATCFGISAQFSGSFDIAFAGVIYRGC